MSSLKQQAIVLGLAIALVGLSVANSLPIIAADPESVKELCRQAQEFIGQGKYEQARTAAERALEIDSRSAEAESLAGAAAFALDDLTAAEKHLGRALALQPRLVTARKALAATYLKQKRLTEARREFLLVLDVQPQDFVCRFSVGLTFLLADQPEAALRHFEKAFWLKSSDPALLTGMLDAQLRLKQEDQAAATLAEIDRQLEERDPRRVEVAALLVKEGAYRLAVPEFERLHKEQPDSYEFGYDLALAYHRSGNDGQASALLRGLLAHNETAELEDLLGEVEQGRGANASSLQAFRRAAELEPRNDDYRFDLAQAFVNQGAHHEALGIFATSSKDFPQSERIWMGWGATNYLLGAYTDAASKLLRAAEIAPQDPRVYYLLGRAYDAAGPFRDAIAQQFARYLSTEPSDAWAHYFYGRILAARRVQGTAGGPDEALQHLEKSVELDGSLAEAHAELGSLREARGQLDAARKELEQSVQLDPNSSSAYYKLARVYRELGRRDQAERAAQKFEQLKAQSPADLDRQHIQEFFEHIRH